LKASTSEQFVRKAAPNAKLVTVSSYNEALEKLFADDIDALIADYPYCAVAAFRHQERGLVAGESRLTFEPIGIGIPADTLMINWVQNFLNLVRGSGDLEAATQRWFDDPSWIRSLPEE
jgi:polar amino acid transport system substrate-binding protein